MAKLTRSTIIDAKTIREFTKELQKSLLSADVEVKLVLEFAKRIESQALSSKPPAGVTPKDYITKIVYDELVALVGKSYEPELKPRRILLMGLYGAGKTTMAAKLAKFYQDRGLSAALLCCDVSRPAAYEQLETLAKNANVPFFGKKGETDPARIVNEGMAKFSGKQVIICDTSGRSALDAALISELKHVSSAFHPTESMLVVSADVGQIAGRQAREFDSATKVSGIIITKMDGSGKGGGALSAANAASVPVTFIGTGEKLADIQTFDAPKFISALLGMADIGALIEHVQEAVRASGMKPEELTAEELNFETFYAQLKAMSGMGSIKKLFGMMGAPDVPKDVVEKGEDKLKKYKVIIASMTKEERRHEKLLHDAERVHRIAIGSGTSEKDVHAMISEFNKMRKMFDTLKNDRNFKKRFTKFM